MYIEGTFPLFLTGSRGQQMKIISECAVMAVEKTERHLDSMYVQRLPGGKQFPYSLQLSEEEEKGNKGKAAIKQGRPFVTVSNMVSFDCSFAIVRDSPWILICYPGTAIPA